MINGTSGVDEILWEVLREADLENFAQLFAEKLQVTKFEHFAHVKDSDLSGIGLSHPAIKRLRAVFKEKRSTLKRQQKTLSFKFKGGKLSPNLSSRFKCTGENFEETNSVTCLISKDDVKLFETLGEGSFGIVKRAIWRKGNGKLDVAVKLLRSFPSGVAGSDTFSEDTLQEINAMHALRHPNLIRLYGLVLSAPIMMVTELCEGGALLDRLRKTNLPVVLIDELVDYGIQIANGMAYLESKLFIHRDLAARNVLLSADEKVVKIGDFGLMRALTTPGEHYVMSGQKKVPFAWCPPESLKFRKFSSASDVWAFGVTLWEMFSFGEEPWCTLTGAEILQKITAGDRLPEPQACPSSVYQLILQCWSFDASQRPTFAALKELLSESDLTLGKCKEAQTGEGLLELDISDQIIVIDGNADSYYWFGQNIRTRKLGKFARKNIVLEEVTIRKRFDGDNEKGSSMFFETGGGGLTSNSISRPIRGSFVHTGHGDARGGTSWGQPDKIDPIFLNNPLWIPPSTKKTTNADIERLKDNAAAVCADDQSSLLSHELVIRQHNGNVTDRISELKERLKVENVPRRNESYHSTNNTLSEPQYISSNTSTNTSGGDSSSFGSSNGFAGDSDPTPISSSGTAPSRPYYSIVPPLDIRKPIPVSAPPVIAIASPSSDVQRLYDDVAADDPFEVPVEVKTLTNRQRYSEMYATTPGPTPFIPPPPSVQYSKVQKNGLKTEQKSVNQTFQFASTMPASVKEVKPPELPRARPASASATSTAMSNSAVATGSPTKATTMFNSTMQLANNAAINARPVAITAPFTYHANAGPGVQNCNPTTSTQSTLVRPYPQNKLVDELTRKLQATNILATKQESSETSSIHNGFMNTVKLPSPSAYVWTGSESFATGIRTQSVPDVSVSSLVATTRKMTNVDTQLLDLFDPLTNRSPPEDMVAKVRAEAPFASADRCAIVLRRCQMNVRDAVVELKMEKLLDMGLAADKNQCLRALETSNWDVNAAASKLLG